MSKGFELNNLNANVSVWMPFEFKKGHIIISKDGRNFILDTGSPETLLTEDVSFSFFKLEKKLNILPVKRILSEINFLTSLEVAGIIGTDFFTNYDVSIDPTSETLYFSTPEGANNLLFNGVKLKLKKILNLPLLSININSHNHDAIIDTGAFVSYIDREFVKDLQPVEKDVLDFTPLMGNFKTDLYEIAVNIANHELKMKFGVLPELYTELLEALNAKIVLGTEILKHFSVYMSLKNNFIILNKIDEIKPENTPERWVQKFNATPDYILESNIPLDSIKDAFVNNEEIINAIKRRIDYSSGSVKYYLEELLKRATKTN